MVSGWEHALKQKLRTAFGNRVSTPAVERVDSIPEARGKGTQLLSHLAEIACYARLDDPCDVGIFLEHAAEERAVYAHDFRRFGSYRRQRAHDLRDERQFPQQGAGSDVSKRDFCRVACGAGQLEAAFSDHESAIGGRIFPKQDLAGQQSAAFGAEGDEAQLVLAQFAKQVDCLKKCDVVGQRQVIASRSGPLGRALTE